MAEMSMGQETKVAEKSNEIVAIPKLLDLLVIEGAIITIDAMGCVSATSRRKWWIRKPTTCWR
jgi:predicted transposase YbfD/YdcC